MTEWTMPTLKDAIDGGLDVAPAKVAKDGRLYYNCGCGRNVQAKDMLDLRNVDFIGKFICDGCKSTLIRKGYITKVELMENCGCPADILEKVNG